MKPIKGVEPSKAHEREFAEAMEYMVEYMSRYIRNNVINGLHVSTVEKFSDYDGVTAKPIRFALPKYREHVQQYMHGWFEDAKGNTYAEYDVGEYTDGLTHKTEQRQHKTQVRDGVEVIQTTINDVLLRFGITDAKQVGNYARVFLTLNARAERKLLKRFSNKRLEKLAAKILGKVNRRNATTFYKNAERAIGIDRAEIMRDGPAINALILETTQWAKKLRDETLEDYTANTLRVMAQGGSLADVLERFEGMEEKRKNHARMVARTQVANFNSLVSKARAQNLGITRARWKTSHDERVRGRPGGKYPNAKTNHWNLEGQEFDISEGIEVNGRTLLPGTDYNCRCTYEFILPDEGQA